MYTQNQFSIFLCWYQVHYSFHLRSFQALFSLIDKYSLHIHKLLDVHIMQNIDMLTNLSESVYLMIKLFFVLGSWISNCCLCVYAPTGSLFPQMEHWGSPTWASLMQAAIRVSLGIDLACQVQLEGSLLPVSAAVKWQNVGASHLVSRIYCSVWIDTRECYCTARTSVNNWWVENKNKLQVLLWGMCENFGKSTWNLWILTCF